MHYAVAGSIQQLILQIYQSDMFCSHLKMHIQGFPTVSGIYQYWEKKVLEVA